MLTIDGSYNEGGGQILRTALTLSLATRTPFRIEKIRVGRKRPGLLRQHLTAVLAAARIANAEVRGAEINSTELTFAPQEVVPGDYRISVGSAGSTMLVLQTVLPVLMLAKEPTTLTLEGGTHNPAAPPYDYVARVYLPLLQRIGARVRSELISAGFFPAGGGIVNISIDPPAELRALDLRQRGKIVRCSARGIVSNLPLSIAERELAVVEQKLGWERSKLTAESVASRGPGNTLFLEVESEQLTEIFTGFGQRKVRAETVAELAIDEAKRYLASEVAVAEHLADQLLLPMALMKGGVFTTLPLSPHSLTNIDTIGKFLPVKIQVHHDDSQRCAVEVYK
ncbi:MAG TPA: RNA 3'-terminal phosphate cyclase [Candidatus Binatia bacterium]